MGKVIIKFKDNHLESFKCKSKERASEIADKRANVSEWNFYENGERIPKPKQKVVEDRTYNEKYYEAIMRKQGLI